MTVQVDRKFVRTSGGLIHYRSAGDDRSLPPIVLLHGGPGSSASLLPLISALGEVRSIIAPDTPGCGCSDPLEEGIPSIVRYADSMIELLDQLNISQCDLYGHHTGAQTSCEIAIAQPARVRRAAFDGSALFPRALREEFLKFYAPAVEPVADGAHLMWVWNFANRLTRYFPHYLPDEAHRMIPGTDLPPATVTSIVAEVLQVWPTWHLAYRAAFEHDLAARLPLVDVPVLVLRSEGDPLAEYASRAASLIPAGRVVHVLRGAKNAVVRDFFS